MVVKVMKELRCCCLLVTGSRSAYWLQMMTPEADLLVVSQPTSRRFNTVSTYIAIHV